MKALLLSTIVIFSSILIKAQSNDTIKNKYQNTAEQLITNNGKLNIGGYGEVHFAQPFIKDYSKAGTLDVHRLVMFLGYNFSKKTQFVSEIEFEYASELWVEQAFLQHKINKYINFKAGLILVPMGIINEYHEPTTFNGVERPIIDNIIAPSTWREVGAGFSGTLLPASLKYQVYMFGGLNGYDTKGVFNGKGFRNGRLKGSKAYANSIATSGKIEYFGIKNLNIGISGYFGKSQSKLYDNLHKDSLTMKENADSSVVGISMFGTDVRYEIKGLELRGQFYLVNLSNTNKYNLFTRSAGKNNDVGSQMLGYYVETGYNVLRPFKKTKYELIPFVRYEFYNTHQAVDRAIVVNDAYKNTMITSGLTFKLNQNAVLKADLQLLKPENADEWTKTFNAGIGINF